MSVSYPQAQIATWPSDMRHFTTLSFTGVIAIGGASAWTLDSICNSDYLTSTLPYEVLTGLSLDPSSLIVETVTNYTLTSSSVETGANGPNATYEFCNVTFAYSHDGRSDRVLVNYFLPPYDSFQNRYLSTGGGGYAINSGASGAEDALVYGAVGGRTDGGFGGFSVNYNTNGVDLLANGTLNYDELFMFGYKAHRELSLIGKQLARNVYAMNDTAKLYAYYEGCSEGGREGWSQVQRYGDEWDGALIGAPAFRYAMQQVHHAFAGVVEQTLGYVPNPCELSAILNATQAFCDPLDGRTDGVVSRTDLCLLQFNTSSTIGMAYDCPVTPLQPAGPFGPTVPGPSLSGNVSSGAAAVVQTWYDGLRDSAGKQAYFFFQPSSTFSDGTPGALDNATGLWEIPVSSLAQPFVVRSLAELESDAFSYENVTYDTLVNDMRLGMQKFYDTLQTTWPDLSAFNASGGKVIHYHGESDFSIPTASSVRYWDSVRSIMYPGLSYNESSAALNDWYRLYLIPGAGHCAKSVNQPLGPYLTNPLATLIEWVEQGQSPDLLPASAPEGAFQNSSGLCAWPTRPMWNSDGDQECVFDQASLDTWHYDLDAFKFPVY